MSATRAPSRATTRRLTGFKPTGPLHLGNLIGAIRPLVDGQHAADSVVFLADLHAMTKEHGPARLRALVLEQATVLLAAGLDLDRSRCYVQSHVPNHARLHYLLECATGYGEAHRMIQFKERSSDAVRLSLLTYPVLMAADILLHGAQEVPVGDDQRQHVELARDIAARFNARYGETFVVPRAVNPPAAARVMDLTAPAAKMGKSTSSEAGTIRLLDPPDVIRRKIMRAVTDARGEVRHDPAAQPGVSNLLEILAACGGGPPAAAAAQFSGYGQLKSAVADAVIATVGPLQARHAELSRDPGYVRQVLADGAAHALASTAEVLRRAEQALGVGV